MCKTVGLKALTGVQQRPSLNSVSYQTPKYSTGNRVPYSNAMQACITIGRITINRGDFDRPWPLCLLRSPSRPAKSSRRGSFGHMPSTGPAKRREQQQLRRALQARKARKAFLFHRFRLAAFAKAATTTRLVLALVHAEYPKISSGVGGIDNGGCDAWLRLKRTQMGSTPSIERRRTAPPAARGAQSPVVPSPVHWRIADQHRVTCGTLRATAFSGCVAWVATGAAAAFLPSSYQASTAARSSPA